MLQEYEKLIGATVTAVLEDDLTFPGQKLYLLAMRTQDGKPIAVDVMADPEGNGPGFLQIYSDEVAP